MSSIAFFAMDLPGIITLPSRATGPSRFTHGSSGGIPAGSSRRNLRWL